MTDTALVLTPRVPWPLDDGGRIAMWQTVWAAGREFHTTLASLVRAGEPPPKLPAEFRALGIRFRAFPHAPPATWRAAVTGLLGRWPFTLARYRNRALDRWLRELGPGERPAFVLVNHLHMLTYQEALPSVPWIYRAHNLEGAWMRSYAARLRPGPRRWFAEHQAGRLTRTELALCRRTAAVLAIQDGEAEWLGRRLPGTMVETLPLGVDFARFPSPNPVHPPVVLLPGTFSWPPNTDGALRFLREGWSEVRRAIPAARLRLAGKDAPRALVDAAIAEGAEMAGFVPSMEEEMARATAVLVPLWSGAGVRVKIVEAMAAGTPVVSTALGADGLRLIPGEDYLLGETPEALAVRLVELLGSAPERTRLSRRGQETARTRWSLESCADLQNSLCREAAERFEHSESSRGER